MDSHGIWTVWMEVFMFSRHIRKHLALTGTKEQRMRFARISRLLSGMIQNTWSSFPGTRSASRIITISLNFIRKKALSSVWQLWKCLGKKHPDLVWWLQMRMTRSQSFRRNRRIRNQIWHPWVSIFLIGIYYASICSRMRLIRNPKMILVIILFRIYFGMAEICMHIVSMATGRM